MRTGNNFVLIHEIIFEGKRSIAWSDVKKYLKRYVGEYFEILDNGECIYIGTDLPDEYTSSDHRIELKGTRAKANANANAVQGIPEIIQNATGKRYKENYDSKHSVDAKFGWYRYNVRFALPVYDNGGVMERYNYFKAELLVRHDKNGKKYLYDIINTKKQK